MYRKNNMNNKLIKKKLYHPKTRKHIFLAQLKAESNYDSFKKAINGIKSHPFGKHAIQASPLPKKRSDLRKNNIIPHSGNLEAEIAWLMESIKENSQKIKDFLNLKSQFENDILLCNYDEAEIILNRINTEICFSNWGVESNFILAEEKKGTENNWLELNETTKNLKDGLSLFLAEQASKKSEQKLSYTRYKNSFDNVISGVSDLLKEYLCFKVLYTGYTGFRNYSFIINVESVSSVLDRYLILVDILTEIAIADNNNLVNKVTKELLEYIPNDSRLQQLLNLVSTDFKDIQIDEELSNYLVQYTCGNYEYCLNKAESIIKEFPTSIESYLIFVKSLIELKYEYREITDAHNINSIAFDLFNVYSKNLNYSSSIENLLKVSQKYFNFKFGKQLFSIISRIIKLRDENNNHVLLYSVNSDFTNSALLSDSILFHAKIRENVFSKIELMSFSNIFDLNRCIAEGDYKKIIDNNDFSLLRKPVYIAKAIKNSCDNNKLINFIENIENKEELSIHSQWELVELLYYAYIEENELQKAIAIFIHNYFKNKNITANLNSNILLLNIQKGNVFIESIDLPIFYSIVCPDIYEQYVKYDDYVESIGINRPMEILIKHDIEQEKIIYFLREICTIEILHHSLNFEGTDDIENERIDILKYLIGVDSEHETEYIEEITEISQRSKIRKAIREVNKGRITINSQLLKNSIDGEIKDNFLRFRELVNFSEEHKLHSIDPTNELLNNYFDSMQEKKLRDRYVIINDPAFISFKSMFLEIRDKFILSKDFGLDGYLSTRIRHGTLINHIRSNFESLHLISQKREDIYIDNEYWNKKLPSSLAGKKDEIQQCLKLFSKRVDDLTEYLIKELIQIKTEKHTLKQKALFDYTFDDKTLAYLFIEIKMSSNSHTAFLNVVLEYLEATTEFLLKRIRDLFKNEITEKYTSIVNELDVSIRDVIGVYPFVDLTSSIVKCQTNIQNEILNIVEWFSIANPSSELILDIETIIQTAIEITNTIYPNDSIVPCIKANNDIPFANGTTSMIYIIRILLDNIIKHSELPVEKRNIVIQSNFVNDTTFELSITNDFKPELLEKVKTNLEETKRKWDEGKEDFENINIEGGSGFDKIRRILAVDMSMQKYKFDFLISGSSLTVKLAIEIKIYTNDDK